MKPMLKPTNSRKDLAHSLTEPSRNHSKLSRAEWEEGQAFKKRAVIQLINATMGGQKKMYGRWLGHHRKNKTYELMQISVSHIFSNINFAIKSVADNAFLNSADNQIKEKALIQLFKNLQGNLGDTFRRWR
jgi:hypothetical protein